MTILSTYFFCVAFLCAAWYCVFMANVLRKPSRLSYVPVKPISIFDDRPEPSPVRKITPPDTVEPAALYTIAAVLLRRHKAKLEGELWGLYETTENRRLTNREAKRAIELLKGLA